MMTTKEPRQSKFHSMSQSKTQTQIQSQSKTQSPKSLPEPCQFSCTYSPCPKPWPGGKKPLMLLGVNGIILTNFDNLDSIPCPPEIVDAMTQNKNKLCQVVKYQYVMTPCICAIKEWTQFIEIRWTSVWNPVVNNVISKTLGLPEFPTCDGIESLSIQDRERPLLLLDDKLESLKFDELKTIKNRIYKRSLTYNHKNDFNWINEVNRFLDCTAMTSYTFNVGLIGLNDGCLGKRKKYLDNVFAGKSPFQNSDIKDVSYVKIELKEPDKYLDWATLKSFLISHPEIHGHVKHLSQHPNAIYLHCHAKLEDNDIINALAGSKDLLLLIYPPVLSLQPCIKKSTTGPLILLDVDGVIVAQNDFFEEFKLEFPDAKPGTCSAGFDDWEFVWSPTIIKCINKWSKFAEIRWLTSWSHSARYNLAPMLGLRDFNVCTFSKRDAINPCVYDSQDLLRPIVWIDDKCTNQRLRSIVKNDVLIIAPKFFLTKQDIAKVNSFLSINDTNCFFM